MSRKDLCFIAALALACAGALAADVQDRTWIKWHERVAMDEQVFAEYTHISTADDRWPDVTRFLYKDAEGTLLVIRSAITLSAADELTAADYSIEHVASGERLTLDLNASGSWTVGAADASITVEDEDPLSVSALAAAKDLLGGHVSPAFRESLHRLATVGAYYCFALHDVGEPLRMLFFPEMDPAPVTNYTEASTGIEKRFDAKRATPSRFDRQFGQAYYE